MAEQYAHYIDGEWVAGSSGERFQSRNPADRDELLGSFPAGDAADVDRAARAAAAAYPGWMRTPAPERADYLLRVALLLEQRRRSSPRS